MEVQSISGRMCRLCLLGMGDLQQRTQRAGDSSSLSVVPTKVLIPILSLSWVLSRLHAGLLCRQAGGGRARCSAIRITMTSAAGADTTKINTVVIRRNRPNMDVSMEVASGCGDKRQGLAGVDKEV